MTGARAVLVGYGPSVYTRAVRMAAAHHGVPYEFASHDPFSDPDGPHPFGRVPVWREEDIVLFETAAILTYLDAQADVTAASPLQAARIQQVAGVVDAYGYWPLVRQVYAHAVFRPLLGETGDPDIIAKGLAAAPRVLSVLDTLAGEGLALRTDAPTRADWHLAPMLAAFVSHPPARDMLAGFAALDGWYTRIREMPAFASTMEEMS